jgi:hypothetical protein
VEEKGYHVNNSGVHNPGVLMILPGNSICSNRLQNKKQPFFNPAVAGRALILRSLLRYNDVHFIPRQLAARWLIIIVMLGAFLNADSAPAQYQPQITGIEVNQVLGVQKDNHKYFVAGKNTVVRVFLSPGVTVDPAATWLNVSRGGNQVFKIYPKKTAGNVTARNGRRVPIDFSLTSTGRPEAFPIPMCFPPAPKYVSWPWP